MRIINGNDVKIALPMPDCIDAMAQAMAAVSAGGVVMPGRHVMPVAGGTRFLGMMPGACDTPQTYGVKVMSIHPANPNQGRPMLQGGLLMFDYETGSPLALINAIEVTAIRTAAVSGLATRLLARENARVLAILGNGVQAASHIDAMLAVRPIEKILVWGRSADKVRDFCKSHSERLGLSVTGASSAEDAVRHADIICTVTAASEPILESDWVAPGAHVNLVGSHDAKHREADDALLARAAVYVDRLEFAISEAGEIVSALQNGAISRDAIRGEIGQLVRGEIAGRAAADQVTLFKSLGVVAQDLVAADLIVKRSQALGLGTAYEF